MKYTIQYRNQGWLYSVYSNESGDDHILTAIHPGVGWVDVAVRLSPDEAALLKESEERFTEFVKEVTANRDKSPYKQRRIDSLIRRLSIDEIEL